MDRRVRRILELIESDGCYLKRRVKLDELAESVSLSRSRLRHIFKSETGLSPGEFVIHLKLERAKELLEVTYLPLKEVAFEVGMYDESHFVRQFRKTFGVTPAHYRTHYVSPEPEQGTPPTPERQNSHSVQKIAQTYKE